MGQAQHGIVRAGSRAACSAQPTWAASSTAKRSCSHTGRVVDPKAGSNRSAVSSAKRVAGPPASRTRRAWARPASELGVRREGAGLDQGRDPGLVEDRAEQLGGQGGLGRGHRLGRSGRQTQDLGVGQLGEDLAQQLPPDLQQVVALVEDHSSGPASRMVSTSSRPWGWSRSRWLVGAAPGARRHPLGVGPLGRSRSPSPSLPLEDGQRLVGQRGEPRPQVATGAGRRAVVRLPGAGPLALDRGVGGEHDRAASPEPRDLVPTRVLPAPGGSVTHQRSLPGALGGDHGLDGLALVRSELVGTGQVVEGWGGREHDGGGVLQR